MKTKKEYLFIHNNKKPTSEEFYSKDSYKLTNFSRPCIEAALDLGYDVYMGINRFFASEVTSDLRITFYNSYIYRSIFNLKDNLRAYKNLNYFLRNHHIDAIHCNTPIGGFLARILAKKHKIKKVIYTAHGFHFYKGAPLVNQLVYKTIEKKLAKITDVIITMNEEDYEAAKKFKLRNSGNVYKVHGVGVSTDVSHINVNRELKLNELGIDSVKTIIISMGDLIKRKNYSTSIKTISKLKEKNIVYLICGKGPEFRYLNKLSVKLGVQDHVKFLGFRTDINELLSISDIFLFTTIQEGLPRSLMEAMSFGLPCVVSNIRGNTDLIEDGIGGYLNKSKDAKGFANSIKKLIDNRELSNKMRHENLNKIKDFDIINVSKEISEIYSKELL